MQTIAGLTTDFVGYEVIIDFLQSKGVLSVDGDFVEIGVFLGGGTCKLSKFLEKQKSSKIIYGIDVFDPSYDLTKDTEHISMADVYSKILDRFGGGSQWEIFSEITKECRNIKVIKGDSKVILIPTDKISFCFIDGNHDPEYVDSDFNLVWNRVSSRGVVAFHDYEFKLPDVTKAVDRIVVRHSGEIREKHHNKDKHILFVVKK